MGSGMRLAAGFLKKSVATMEFVSGMHLERLLANPKVAELESMMAQGSGHSKVTEWESTMAQDSGNWKVAASDSMTERGSQASSVESEVRVSVVMVIESDSATALCSGRVSESSSRVRWAAEMVLATVMRFAPV